MSVPAENVTTGLELPGHRIVRNLGIVRGNVVYPCLTQKDMDRLRAIAHGKKVPPQQEPWHTGRAEYFANLRVESHQSMIGQASDCGANAIIGVRYETYGVEKGLVEFSAYGTAVVVEPIN